jgi:shikimate dehydrogenase
MSLSARPGNFGSCFHNRLYELKNLDYVYKAFSTTNLPAAIEGMRALGIRGCAISMPFKEAVIPLLDRLAPSANAIESVNTIVNDDGVLTGHNTDYGAVVDLVADIDHAMPFLLRGSGGMAKAVAAALSDSGFRSGRIVARNEAAGRKLAYLYGYDWISEPEGNTPFIVNATPLGMTGSDVEEFAFPVTMIEACEIAFDVVQYPPKTPFLSLAAKAGKRCITGAEVATLQALQQFVLYTGVVPDSLQVAEAAHWARANA